MSESLSVRDFWVTLVSIFAACVYGIIFLYYLNALMGLIITFFVRWFVIDKHTRFHVKSIVISPLSGRIFCKGIFYQNQDFTLRVVDGYITLALMYSYPKCKRIHEEMLSKDLLHMRCQVTSTLKKKKGTIVAVDLKKKKICVRSSPDDATESRSDEEEGSDATRENDTSPLESLHSGNWSEEPEEFSPREAEATDGPADQKGKRKIFQKPPVQSSAPAGDTGGGGHLQWYNYTDVLLPQTYSRCRLHLNGVEVSLYNATGKYDELVAAANEMAGAPASPPEDESLGRKKFIDALKNRIKEKVGGNTGKGNDASELHVAKQIQKEQLEKTTFMQNFFEFVRSIEVDIDTASVSVGGAASDFPFFFYGSCSRASGCLYRTRNGCQPIDLYREVYDFSFQNVNLRMSEMTPEWKKLEYQFPEQESSSKPKGFDSLGDFCLILDGGTKNAIHLLMYLDSPNIYAGEPITRETIPRSGIEIVLDVPFLRAGPWTEFCRMKLFDFFLPPNYLPLRPLIYRVGDIRPRAPLDFVVSFKRQTTIEVPFKRPSPTSKPPFSIVDSGEVGFISGKLGECSEYIQRGAFLLEGESRQCLKMMFSGKNIELSSNAILGLPCELTKVDSLQCYIDREDGEIWNQRKKWSFTFAVSKASFNFSMSYINFFLDFVNDYQFAANMYLGKTLSTEDYNTKNRFIRDFIPQVRKFELIVENGLEVQFNVNHQNVIYGKDPFNPKQNMLVMLRVSSGCFEMDIPADQYQLSSRNEIVRPLTLQAQDILVHLSLPPSHPCCSAYDVNIPFGWIKRFEMFGAFINNVPNQSVPQDFRAPTLVNHLLLDIILTEIRANIRGCHIKAILDFMENHFIDHSASIAPNELFWLFTLLQSQAAFGKNKKKEWLDFLGSFLPAPNFMETTVTVILKDTEAILEKPGSEGVSPARPDISPSVPHVVARLAELVVVVLKQAAAQELNVTLTPITVRWLEDKELRSSEKTTENFQFPQPKTSPSPETYRKKSSFFSTGEISIGLIRHHGPLPARIKVQQVLDICVDGVAFDINSVNVTTLTEILASLKGEFLSEDKALEAALYRARFEAEQSLRTKVPNMSFSGNENDDDFDLLFHEDPQTPNLEVSSSIAEGRLPQRTGERPRAPEGGTTVGYHFPSPSTLMTQHLESKPLKSSFTTAPSTRGISAESVKPNAVSDSPLSVPLSLAEGFAKLMEQEERHESLFQEYGLIFLRVRVPHASGALWLSASDLFWLELPSGIKLESSSVNTPDATKQLALRVQEVILRGMCSASTVCEEKILAEALRSGRMRNNTTGVFHCGVENTGEQPESSSKSDGSDLGELLNPLVEVFHLQTGMALVHHTESTVDGTLMQHMLKQRHFVTSLNSKKLIHEHIFFMRPHSSRRSSEAIHISPTRPQARGRADHEAERSLPHDAEMHPQKPTKQQIKSPTKYPIMEERTGNLSSCENAPLKKKNTLIRISSAPTSDGPVPGKSVTCTAEPTLVQKPASELASERISSPTPNLDLPLRSPVSLKSSVSQERQHSPYLVEANAPLDNSAVPINLIRGEKAIVSEAEQDTELQYGTATTFTELQSNNFFSCVSCSSKGSLKSFCSEGANTSQPVVEQPAAKTAQSHEKIEPLSIVVNSHSDSEAASDGSVSPRAVFASFLAEQHDQETETVVTEGSTHLSDLDSGEIPPSEPTTPPAPQAIRPWRYYSFYHQVEFQSFTSLAYNPRRQTSDKSNDKTAFSAPIPRVLFLPLLPLHNFSAIYTPIADNSGEASELSEPQSDPSLLRYGKRDSEALESIPGVNNSSAALFDQNSRLTLSHQQHIVRQHIAVECTLPLDVYLTSEACPLVGEAVSFAHRCKNSLALHSTVGDNENLPNEMKPFASPEGTRNTTAAKKGKLKMSARVFYKTRKPLTLHVIVAKISEVRLNVVGKWSLATEMMIRNPARLDHLTSKESLIHLSLCAYDLNLTCQKRPGPSNANGKTKGQKISVILRHSSIVGVSSIEDKSASRGDLRVEIPNFKRQEIDHCVSGIVFIGGGGGKACVHNAPLHVAMSPLHLGLVGLHFTRDFSDTLLMLRHMGEMLGNSLRSTQQAKPTNQWETHSSSAGASHVNSDEEFLSSECTDSVTSPVHHDMLFFDHGRRQLEGKATLQGISISVYDIVRLPMLAAQSPNIMGKENSVQQQWIMHQDANSFEVGPSFINFSAKVEQNYTSTKTCVHCVSSVGNIKVKLYPSMLYIMSSAASVFSSSAGALHSVASKESLFQSVSGGPSPTLRHGASVSSPQQQLERVETVDINISCRFHNLEGWILETAQNFMHLKIKDIAVCHSSQNEEFRAKDDFDMSELSLFAKTRLYYLAIRAKLKFLKKDAVAPCCTMCRPQLKSTTSLSLSEIVAAYEPDTSLEESGLSSPIGKRFKSVGEVLTISVDNLPITVHVGTVPEILNTQLNISGNLIGLKFYFPYVPPFVEMVYPQLQHFVFRWRKAASESAALRLSNVNIPAPQSPAPSRRGSVSAKHFFDENSKPSMENVYNNCFSQAPPGYSVWLSLAVEHSEMRMGLDDLATQVFQLPKLVLFVQASESRWNLKAHVHSCFVSSGRGRRKEYEVGLPEVFVDFGGDEVKMCVAVVVGRVCADITSLMAHHLILAFHKVVEEILPLLKPIPVNNEEAIPIVSIYESAPTLELIQKSRSRKQNVTLLLCGGRVSCVTDKSALRISTCYICAHGKSEPEHHRKQLDWKLRLENSQVALTDRKDTHSKKSANHGTTGHRLGGTADSMMSRASSITHFAVQGQHSLPSPGKWRGAIEAEYCGFIWGSVNFSCSLSTEVTNEQKGLDMFLQNTSFVARGADVRSAILSRVGDSVSRWSFDVESPAIIARLGLPELLEQSMGEAKSDLELFSKDSFQKKRNLLEYLESNQKFRDLRTQREEIIRIIEIAEKEHKENIHMGEMQVAQELCTRVAANLTGRAAKEFWANVKSQSRHTGVGTVSQICVVVPLGDRSYRRVIESIAYPPPENDPKSTFSNLPASTDTESRSYVPYFALKLQIRRTSLLFSLQKADTSFQAMIKESLSLNVGSSADFRKSLNSSTSTSSVSLNGRLNASEIRLFFTSGSPMPFAPPINQLLTEATIIGGQGVLNCFRGEEFRFSRNSITVRSIGMPFNFKKADTVQVKAVVDVAAPEVQISPWIFVIVSEIEQEFPSKRHKRTASKPKRKPTTPWRSPKFSSGDGKKHIFSSFAGRASSTPKAKDSIPLYVDISARVDKGQLLCYCQTYGEEVYQAPSMPKSSKFDRVRAETKANSNKKLFVKDRFKSTGFLGNNFCIDWNSDDMVACAPIPLPLSVVQICERRTQEEGENRIIRAEVNFGEIVLSPAIFMVTEEIEKVVTNHESFKAQHKRVLCKTIEEMHVDEDMTQVLAHLRCSLLDIMLPTPQGYLSALKSHAKPHSHLHHSWSIFSAEGVLLDEEPGTPSKTSVHLSINNFRVIFDTTPIHTTTFSLFLSDHGSIDMLLSLERNKITDGISVKHPDSTIIFHIHQLRAECQTRLEVKSMEMFVPELTVSVSKRKMKDTVAQTVSVNLPLNLDSSEQNLLIRSQHLSQFFIVRELWTRTLKGFMKVVSKAFCRETVLGAFPTHSSAVPSSASRSSMFAGTTPDGRLIAVRKRNNYLFLVASVYSGWLEVDLGGGNVHRLHTGSLNFALEKSIRRGERTVTYASKVSLRDLVIKSDGLLGGSIRVTQLMVMFYRIQNLLLQRVFIRSTEGRTFRICVEAHGISCSTKERHVKDVLELKGENIVFHAMDGISSDKYALANVKMDIDTAKLRLTPSTMPAFLNLVYSLSVNLNERRANGAEKIRYSYQSKQLPPYVLHHLEWINNSSPKTSTASSPKPSLGHEFPRKTSSIPFMGTAMERIPCGQLQLRVYNTTFLLGVASGEEAKSGTVVIHIPTATVAFAECTSSSYKVVKRALRITTENVELYRPLPTKSLIMGLRGSNVLEFYTRQKIGVEEVGFTLDLSQSHPWTGNPLYRDFAEVAQLINHFIDNSNYQVLEKMMKGMASTESPLEEPSELTPSLKQLQTEQQQSQFQTTTAGTGIRATEAENKRQMDPRVFKALRPAKFSPQVRFGGDISVNTEVILNWFGVTEKVLPRAIHCAIGDKLESLMDNILMKTQAQVAGGTSSSSTS